MSAEGFFSFKRTGRTAALALFCVIAVLPPAQADTKQIKAYKESFPDEKPKCIHCHLDEKPKKEGPHELNEYGKKAKTLADEAKKEAPDADSYKQAGQIQ